MLGLGEFVGEPAGESSTRGGGSSSSLSLLLAFFFLLVVLMAGGFLAEVEVLEVVVLSVAFVVDVVEVVEVLGVGTLLFVKGTEERQVRFGSCKNSLYAKRHKKDKYEIEIAGIL